MTDQQQTNPAIPQAVLDHWTANVSQPAQEMLEKFRVNNLLTCAFHKVTDDVTEGLPSAMLSVYKGVFGISLLGWPDPQFMVTVIAVPNIVLMYETAASLDDAYLKLQKGLKILNAMAVAIFN